MVHKVLSIIASVLFFAMTIAFAVCLVYTLASPAVQAGIGNATAAIDGAVTQASKAMDTSWGIDLSGLFGGTGNAADAATGGSAAGGSASTAAQGAGTGAASTSAANSSSAFAATAQGQAYLAWKEGVADPVGRIFAGTDVTADLLEGVAGGSSSAGDVLASLDEAMLSAVGSNASSYAATVAATTVPASLPGDVRAKMWEADSAAQSFAASVQTVVGGVRSVKSGALGALGELVGAVNTALGDLQNFDACVAEAEGLLGYAG